MDSLPKGIGDTFRSPLSFALGARGPTWTHCRKALVTKRASHPTRSEGSLASDMDSLPKGIGDTSFSMKEISALTVEVRHGLTAERHW